MSLEEFKQRPWRTSHNAYRESSLSLNPAPEYVSSSEILVAGLCREIGLESVGEREVAKRGRDLEARIAQFRDRGERPGGAALDGDAFQGLLHAVLESPKLPNQSSKRFLQVSPLVPAAAIGSGAVRLAGSPWAAGGLVRRMIWLGSANNASAEAAWSRLFDALSVTSEDDVFARFLQQELDAWIGDQQWEYLPGPAGEAGLPLGELAGRACPARQFAKDISAIVAAKDRMTRRQWTSLLEAVIRIGSVAHVMWLCEVQANIWRCLRDSLAGAPPIDAGEARTCVFPSQLSYLSYGNAALPGIRDRTSAYLVARLGINSVLWSLDAAGRGFDRKLSSASDVAALCSHAAASRNALDQLGVLDTFDEVQENEAGALLCSKGIGNNITEFARHALGQRQAANPILRGYDQGYILAKRGKARSAPWVCSLGPVAVLSLVHCCLSGVAGSRSIHRLAQHLEAYGIVVDARQVSQNDLGHQLRMLGLVLDSPDAETGMLLVPPFTHAGADGEAVQP